jgi:hypothetical protein
MAATIEVSVLSSLMQDELEDLATKGSEGESVTTEQMCNALASAIAEHLNATIVLSYQTHTHPYVDTPAGAATTSATLTP